MNKKFSTSWKASRRPGKQRKYLANAPLHIKNKLMSVNLDKDLRKKHNTRNVTIRKGDTVKVMKGKFKGKRGKVTRVMLKISKIIIDGVNIKKIDGSKADVKMRPSNLQIIELNMDDKRRFKSTNKSQKNTGKVAEEKK